MIGSFVGKRVIVSRHLTVDAPWKRPYYVRRTWRERLFSRPWQPWRTTRLIMVVERIPDMRAYLLGPDTIIMHPVLLEEVKSRIADEGYTIPVKGWIE